MPRIYLAKPLVQCFFVPFRILFLQIRRRQRTNAASRLFTAVAHAYSTMTMMISTTTTTTAEEPPVAAQHAVNEKRIDVIAFGARVDCAVTLSLAVSGWLSPFANKCICQPENPAESAIYLGNSHTDNIFVYSMALFLSPRIYANISFCFLSQCMCLCALIE